MSRIIRDHNREALAPTACGWCECVSASTYREHRHCALGATGAISGVRWFGQ
jgi:hypothetical protein